MAGMDFLRHSGIVTGHSGAPRSGEPGIHNHDIFGHGNAMQINSRLCLWIPGPSLRDVPE